LNIFSKHFESFHARSEYTLLPTTTIKNGGLRTCLKPLMTEISNLGKFIVMFHLVIMMYE